MTLRVIEQFGQYKPGDTITDPKAIQAIVESEQVAYVRRIPDEAPAGQPTPKK